ncbi:hypothetical protein MOD91_18260 [Bacillus haynesii]|nr:hypothetical protein [Bacillus haynesii]MCY8048467.1 hypothetical protein [Bacillus haynesii]MCY8668805.1 hypothetical protein [Bacillus haynesii]MCY9324056.1 hypothetical protein [Bacillus haynesii]
MRDLYKLMSALTSFFALLNGGVKGLAKNQVNKQAHKATAKAMRKLWK